MRKPPCCECFGRTVTSFLSFASSFLRSQCNRLINGFTSNRSVLCVNSKAIACRVEVTIVIVRQNKSQWRMRCEKKGHRKELGIDSRFQNNSFSKFIFLWATASLNPCINFLITQMTFMCYTFNRIRFICHSIFIMRSKIMWGWRWPFVQRMIYIHIHSYMKWSGTNTRLIRDLRYESHITHAHTHIIS